MKSLILDALKTAVETYPDVFEHLKGRAAIIAIENELLKWQERALQGKLKYDSDIIPDAISDMVNEMLSYATSKDEILTVFQDVITFLKKEDEKERHKKIPYRGKRAYVYTPGDTEITQSDIDEAVAYWDKVMPDYKGLLDAKVNNE